MGLCKLSSLSHKVVIVVQFSSNYSSCCFRRHTTTPQPALKRVKACDALRNLSGRDV